MESIGVVAGIESMFNQVIVDPKDRDVLRFLWWPNGDLSKDLAEYRITKHKIAKSSKNQNQNQNRQNQNRQSSKSSPSIVEIPEEERAKSVANLEIEQLPIESTLGLKWNAELDQFVWEMSTEKMSALYDKPVTWRSLLSVIYLLFDPLGFIAPLTMKAKLWMQTLCRKKVTWDADIEEPERAQWERWIADLADLENVHVNRCFKPDDFGKVETVELHVFSDASRVGYAAVAYLAFCYGRQNLVCFRDWKDEVSPYQRDINTKVGTVCRCCISEVKSSGLKRTRYDAQPGISLDKLNVCTQVQ